ncbi:MAG: hypothetical protein NVSMB24_32810 [Mucilaginibacter sp.]
MEKYILTIVLAALCLFFRAEAQALKTINGKVVDSATSQPLEGATVKLQSGGTTSTNKQGEFNLTSQSSSGTIQISYQGYKTINLTYDKTQKWPLAISLQAKAASLKEVDIVSTGYQTFPKERATGSFVLIDSLLLNRRIGTTVLDRLDGVSSGLLFNQSLGNGNNAAISIRGRSTIFANPDPLIVLDNFPYDGDLNNINPNDIESISILKDAAAASIWGIKAGNGVIVITSKKGKLDRKTHISFYANTTVSQRPNLFYQPQMSSSDYVNLEQYLFNKGYYTNAISDGFSTISPAVAIFLQKQNGQISAADSASQINRFKRQDIRHDLEKYVYRPAVNQQYALSLDGGGKFNTYYVSAGYDNNKENTVGNNYRRTVKRAGT